jgi:uncharacterized membrane protein
MQMGKKVFVIYPGRFHPFHTGHKGVYNYLSTKFGGNDVYITTTGVVELPKSPFSFDEKKEMMMATGIPSNKILNVKNNYNLQSVSSQIPINVERDSIIFAVSQKDMAEDPRFKNFVKKDGSPSYLQPMPKNESKLEPAIKHGYLITVPTTDFTVLGLPARSASQLRSQYSTLKPEQQKAFIVDLFGSYNPKIHKILNNKLGNTGGKLTEKQKKLLKKLIVGILKEDEDKINSAKEKRNAAEEDLRQAELEGAEEDLKKANDNLSSATTPEEKDAAEANVKIKKALVDSKKIALQSKQD